jgi:hypothetical protein
VKTCVLADVCVTVHGDRSFENSVATNSRFMTQPDFARYNGVVADDRFVFDTHATSDNRVPKNGGIRSDENAGFDARAQGDKPSTIDVAEAVLPVATIELHRTKHWLDAVVSSY